MQIFINGIATITVIFSFLLILIAFLKDAKVFQNTRADEVIKYIAIFTLSFIAILFVRFWIHNSYHGTVAMFDWVTLYAPRTPTEGILTDTVFVGAFMLAVLRFNFNPPKFNSLAIFIAAFISRPILLLAGFHFSHRETIEQVLAQISTAGDSPHYLRIAEYFYDSQGEFANLIVFFPLYPMLMRIVGTVMPLLYAGLLVSWVSFGFAAVALYKICKGELFPVLLLCFAPFGIFFGTVFTESLFVALTLFSILMAMEKKWLWAVVFGFFSALTRSQGMVVLAFFLYEYGLHCMENSQNIKEGLRKVRFDILYALLIPFGMFLYLLLNRVVQGDWFIFLEHQAAPPWWNTAGWIGDNLAGQWYWGANFGLGAIIYFVQIAAFFVVFALLIYSVFNKQRISFVLYGFGYMYTTFTHGWLISGPRYVTGLVVLYILLNQIENKFIRGGLFVASVVLSIHFNRLFLDGHSLM